MTIREELEELEAKVLSPFAMLSRNTKGRVRYEEPCPIRPAFQRDRDRIIHSKSFRRLKHKTQVFLAPTGDHYRTRLTHVIEVSQIARTISKALRLNEDLTEAIALGHDLGHTPFGHAGEATLNEVYPGGFKHVVHSLRVVDELEGGGKGLNLTYEVRDGIAKHSKGMGTIDNPEYCPATMEGQVVRVSDLVAYANHDTDDAIRSGIITTDDLPAGCVSVLGATSRERINTMVTDIIDATMSTGEGRVAISAEVEEAMVELRNYLFNTVYMNEKIRANFLKAQKILTELYGYLCDNPEEFWDLYGKDSSGDGDLERSVCDFIAGMTDSYALAVYKKIFLPESWHGEISAL
ncbi:MAG: deoxyguanosinetriphosphate triphosphohydrolase [Thermodesulfobacteriota bacterium]